MEMKWIKIGHGKMLAGAQEEPEVLTKNLCQKENFGI